MIPRYWLASFWVLLGIGCWLIQATLMLQRTTAEGKPRVFADPLPPRVEKLSRMEAPALTPHPDVKVHARAKPRAPGAVSHDWKTFLGPSHNAVSAETK